VDLTIALDRYDRHIPFFMGMVETLPSFSLQALEVGMVPPRRDGVDRHKRMLVGHEFDIAEVSLASYIISKRAGGPFCAVPVFPRRLFSQNHIFVKADAGSENPKDMIGKRVAIWAFQITMSVLAKGDLQSEYDVPWREVKWHTGRPEEITWSDDSAPCIAFRTDAPARRC
jgi:4,5-dihydroxyphthalate decarboxylase